MSLNISSYTKVKHFLSLLLPILLANLRSRVSPGSIVS
jgi:hypothetical protein